MDERTELLSPVDCGLSPIRGFLPKTDPLPALPERFRFIDEISASIPEIIRAGVVRKELENLPIPRLAPVHRTDQLERLFACYTHLASAWYWGDERPIDYIPEGIAWPIYYLGKRLGMPPVLTYKPYVLDNWRRKDPHGPIQIENLEVLHQFTDLTDGDWFILTHVEIEANAGPIPSAIYYGQRDILWDRPENLSLHLRVIASATEKMYRTLCRMREGCDPSRYYHDVRPYLFGFKNVIYKGVKEYENQPRSLRGETGAQSTIVPCLDAALGIEHTSDPGNPDPLLLYLMEMRKYIPPGHLRFLGSVEKADAKGVSIRECVLQNPELQMLYNDCVYWLAKFREEHIGLATTHIHEQAQASSTNPVHTGTGGTPYMQYLKKHLKETWEAAIL